MSSIFTQIIDGNIPSHKVYEDDKTLAFLDIKPIQPGQVLVIPKTEVDHLWDLSESDYQALMATVRKVGQYMREKLPTTRIGVQIEGLEVPHAHVKLIPFSTAGEFRGQDQPAEEADLAKMAELLRM